MADSDPVTKKDLLDLEARLEARSDARFDTKLNAVAERLRNVS
jgi:hypothetical protein